METAAGTYLEVFRIGPLPGQTDAEPPGGDDDGDAAETNDHRLLGPGDSLAAHARRSRDDSRHFPGSNDFFMTEICGKGWDGKWVSGKWMRWEMGEWQMDEMR